MKTWRCKPWAQAEGVTWSERAIQRDTFSQEQCEVCPAELCPNIRATRAFSDPQTQTSQAEDHNQITKLHLGFATPSAGPRQVLLSSNYSLPPSFWGLSERNADRLSYLPFGSGGGELNDNPKADPKSKSRIDVKSVQPYGRQASMEVAPHIHWDI